MQPDIINITPNRAITDSIFQYNCIKCNSEVKITYEGRRYKLRKNNQNICRNCFDLSFNRFKNTPPPRKVGGSRIYNISIEQAKRTQKACRKTRYLWLGFMKNKDKIISVHSDKYLGCTHDFFVEYITGQFNDKMTIENYAEYWNFDHIKPLRQAIEESEESFKHACHYSNIRPLKISENIKRRGRYHG